MTTQDRLARFLLLSSEKKRALLGDSVASRGGASEPEPVPRTSWPMRFPASAGQEALWLQWRLAPRSPDHNVPHCHEIRGPLDINALSTAFDAVVACHEALRTTFAEEGDELVQLAHRQLSGVLRIRAVPARDDALREARRLIATPFDLRKGPLIRARIWRYAPDTHLLTVVCHHIVIDERSSRVIERDLSTCYRAAIRGAAPALAAPRLQPGDIAAAERRRDHGPDLAYWAAWLADSDCAELPLDVPRPLARSRRGATYERGLGASARQALTRLCQGRGITPFMAAAAVFAVFLTQQTGRTDITFTTPLSGRDSAGSTETVGYFLNLLPLRVRLDLDGSCHEVAESIRVAFTAARRHAAAPFSMVVRALGRAGSAARSPVSDAVFVHLSEQQTAPGMDLGDGLRGSSLNLAPEGATSDMTVALVDTPDRLILAFRYATDLYRPATIERWAADLAALMTRLADDPAAPLTDLLG